MAVLAAGIEDRYFIHSQGLHRPEPGAIRVRVGSGIRFPSYPTVAQAPCAGCDTFRGEAGPVAGALDPAGAVPRGLRESPAWMLPMKSLMLAKQKRRRHILRRRHRAKQDRALGIADTFLATSLRHGVRSRRRASLPTAGYYDPECMENARWARISGVQACMFDSRPFQCESDVEEDFREMRRGCWVR